MSSHPDEREFRSMESAPRDGTEVWIFDKGYSGPPEAVLARVVNGWVTDEFIPVGIADDDLAGMNHAAIPESSCLGWAPSI